MSEDNNPMEIPAEDLQPSKTWKDELAWYLLVMGFIMILVAGLCFFLFRNSPLTYADFSINANTLGKYLMMGGLGFYVAGRALHYYSKFKKRRENP